MGKVDAECKHEKTHYEDWPDGGCIEVCEDCGMSRHHWEWGESNWIMIEDIEGTRKELQEGIDNMMKSIKKVEPNEKTNNIKDT